MKISMNAVEAAALASVVEVEKMPGADTKAVKMTVEETGDVTIEVTPECLLDYVGIISKLKVLAQPVVAGVEEFIKTAGELGEAFGKKWVEEEEKKIA